MTTSPIDHAAHAEALNTSLGRSFPASAALAIAILADAGAGDLADLLTFATLPDQADVPIRNQARLACHQILAELDRTTVELLADGPTPRHTIAGTTADGATVYFGKRNARDLSSADLIGYVHLDPSRRSAIHYVSLITLGLEHPAYVPPGQQDTRPMPDQITSRIQAHLATLPAALIEAWSNAQELDALGEPAPDIPACLALGHDPADLAATTRAMLSEFA